MADPVAGPSVPAEFNVDVIPAPMPNEAAELDLLHWLLLLPAQAESDQEAA